jgi:hypothetical protein
VLASLVVLLSSLAFGWNTGVMNSVAAVVFPGHTPLQWSLVVSAFCAGGPVR